MRVPSHALALASAIILTASVKFFAGVLQQLLRYLKRLDALEVCSSIALSQTLGPLLLQPQRIPMNVQPQQLIDDSIAITEILIG